MPDKNGVITDAENAKIVAWLNKKGVNHSCPICNQNDWSIGSHVISSNVHIANGVMLGGPSYPIVFTVCNNCAYVRQFMAVPMGLLSEDKKNGA